MGFSGAVKLTGLDDYITPSQACVIALDDGKIKAEDFVSDEVQVEFLYVTLGAFAYPLMSSPTRDTTLRFTKPMIATSDINLLCLLLSQDPHKERSSARPGA